MIRPAADAAPTVRAASPDPHGTSWVAHVLALGCAAMVADFIAVAMVGSTDIWTTVWTLPILIFVLVTLVVGWYLAWRRPRISLGWIMLVIAILLAMMGPLTQVAAALVPAHPTLAAWLLCLTGTDSMPSGSWILPIGLLFTQLPLRYPTGRLPSRGWTWFSWCTIVALPVADVLLDTSVPSFGFGLANPVHVEWGGAEQPLMLVVFALLLAGSFIGSIASLFVRYHGADTIERTQLRWVFWALAVSVGTLLVGWIISLLTPADGPLGWANVAISVLTALCYSLVPVAIFFAVTRRGLYSIDRIISRTASYAIVTAIIVSGYFGIILGLTSLVPGLPSMGVAVATLAAAGVFLPLLRRVRRDIDRRFNRAAYDAERVVDAFGERLRDGHDPHTTGNDLAVAVDQTLQPAALGLWTRSPR